VTTSSFTEDTATAQQTTDESLKMVSTDQLIFAGVIGGVFGALLMLFLLYFFYATGSYFREAAAAYSNSNIKQQQQ
jgi:hypothetical protein